MNLSWLLLKLPHGTVTWCWVNWERPWSTLEVWLYCPSTLVSDNFHFCNLLLFRNLHKGVKVLMWKTDLAFVLSSTFVYKVAVIVAVSSFPLYVIKAAHQRLNPAAYKKVAGIWASATQRGWVCICMHFGCLLYEMAALAQLIRSSILPDRGWSVGQRPVEVHVELNMVILVNRGVLSIVTSIQLLPTLMQRTPLGKQDYM